ncbi:hypothetical protein [Desulfocurvus sp. DL9XJH121]
MSLVYKFRLTKLLHDQVQVSGQHVDSVLRSWTEKDYKHLCEYVTQCTGVVPKYVARLSRLCGLSPQGVVMDILGAQAPQASAAGGDGSYGVAEGLGYIPDDSVERYAFLQSIVRGREKAI